MTRTCPICQKDDAVRDKDHPSFYVGDRLTARCFHGNSHPNGGPVSFFLDSGELVKAVALTDAQSLYQVAQKGEARGYSGHFLGDKCGIYGLTVADLALSSSPVPTEKWVRSWEAQGVPVTVAPFYKGADLVGLEVRAMQEKASPRPGETAGKSGDTRKFVGEAGLYVSAPHGQPKCVIGFEGVWDAVAAAWDAFQEDSEDYVFVAFNATTNAQKITRPTLDAMFPGVPRVFVTDQDKPGQQNRKWLEKIGVTAILPGTGLAKDYREADPKKRWKALLDGVERALETGIPVQNQNDTGVWKIAKRALDGAMQGKKQGMRDLEAWRFGQRCAGMCKAVPGGRKFFAIRANLYGTTVTAEGQYDFEPVISHRVFQEIEQAYPDLAAVIRAGATEHPLSPQWRPPMFIEDGRHWSEVPKNDRVAYARAHGWEPWIGKDPGTPKGSDMDTVVDHMRSAYAFVQTPNAPDSEIGLRMAIWCIAAALCALRAEEMWDQNMPTGFLPWIWFYGGPATGKGMALKVIAACLTGDLRTYGSQRFGGDKEYDWLTESVLHLPICFRDELDSFMRSGNVEDLKTMLAGEALQLRKKFGTDMAISPRPVVIASNAMRINSDDEATQERITLVELQPNPMASKKERNNAFERFYEWLETDGRGIFYRLTLHLYKDFRSVEISRSTNSRSAMLDAAVRLLADRLAIKPSEVFRPALANRDEAVLKGASWFRPLLEFVEHEMGNTTHGTAKVLDLWGLSTSDPNQKRNYYRWLDQFKHAAGSHGLQVGHYVVTLMEGTGAASRVFQFSRAGVLDALA